LRPNAVSSAWRILGIQRHTSTIMLSAVLWVVTALADARFPHGNPPSARARIATIPLVPLTALHPTQLVEDRHMTGLDGLATKGPASSGEHRA
jgi:hypothetical protein